jgi:DnaJ-class molecular chaperone
MKVVICDNCNGTGAEVCDYCSGSGYTGSETCPVCDGEKRETCTKCWGTGDVEIPQGYEEERISRSWKEDEWA